MSPASPFAQPVDPELLARARTGEHQAVAELYRRFGTPVYNLARRLGCGPELAEEVLQDVFVELMQSLPRYVAQAPFWAWLRAIAVHRGLDALRRRSPLSLEAWLEEGHAEPAAPGSPGDTELALDLLRALDRLRPGPRAVLWLHLVEGYSHKEIAGLFGKSESYSKSALARAVRQLRATSGGPEEDEHYVRA